MKRPFVVIYRERVSPYQVFGWFCMAESREEAGKFFFRHVNVSKENGNLQDVLDFNPQTITTLLELHKYHVCRVCKQVKAEVDYESGKGRCDTCVQLDRDIILDGSEQGQVGQVCRICEVRKPEVDHSCGDHWCGVCLISAID